MNLENRKLWQVGAGDGKRKYDHICLQYDVMMIGPGDLGPYDEHLYAEKGIDQDVRSMIRRFHDDVKPGHVVLLRRGSRVLAVGEVAEERVQWLEEFGDIDGWRLQHVRRVRWFKTEESPKHGRFPGRFSSVKKRAVRAWLEGLEIPEEQFKGRLRPLPEGSRKLNDDMLRRRLSHAGLPSNHIDKLLSALGSIHSLARMYLDANQRRRWVKRPSEHETIAYLVVPLLSALGWSPETMAIEWENIDVALFDGIPSEDSADSTLGYVVEVKSLGGSVLNRKAIEQAKDYATQEGRDNCRGLIITDGIRYSYFRRETDFAKLHAYLNIRCMRDSYPVFHCGGAVEFITAIAR